jgi:uncharacterized membrane protein
LFGRKRKAGAGRRRIRKLRLTVILLILALLGVTSFTFGMITAVASQIPNCDPARVPREVDGHIYAGDNKTILATLRGAESRILVGSNQITLTAWGVGQLFSARAVYLQIGAMLGTMMVGNVFFVIIPAHRELVRAKEAGREPDPAANQRGKLRSVHNNYLTLPVVFTMLSNHFPFTYGHSYAWLILVVLLVIGVWIRHFFNLRHVGRTVWAIPVTAAIAIAALAILIRPQTESTAGTPAVSFVRVARIVDQRCTACHSEHPTKVDSAPRGVKLDTAEEIKAQAEAIQVQAVQTKAMPLGNVTGMTQAERDLLGRWIAQGARIP